MRTELNRVFLTAAVVFLAATTAYTIEIETVPIGNPGNAGELSGGGITPAAVVGAVGYEYNIGKYEVTCSQYVEFLNAVAATDPYGLYNSDMWSDDYGCKIERTGSPDTYAYSVVPDRANRPVNYVSWYDAARFSNWLTTGDTETGVYTFADGTLTDTLDHETAAATLGGTAWFIPTEDEWYKAAYHKNDGATGNYWDFAIGKDTVPSNNLITPDPGDNANFWDATDGHTIGAPYYTTEVGEFENSDSPYGTFDQTGNLYEWNETLISESWRGLRGGAWHSGFPRFYASKRDKNPPTNEYYGIGFRVASIPRPDSLITGDLNNDWAVNSSDLDLIRSFWGKTVEPGNGLMGDGTGDGLVDSADLDIVRTNWGAKVAAVPEPSILFLTISSAVFLAWRRY